MEPAIITITGSRNTFSGGPIRHFQAHAATLRVSLKTGETLAGADAIVAEIHASQLSTPASVLAAASVDIDTGNEEGPIDIDLTAAQMNQTVAEEYRDLWLVIYAHYDAEDRSEVLYVGYLRLVRHQASNTTPAPPSPALYLTASAAAATYASAAFKTLAVTGQSSVVADAKDDTLTLAAGNAVSITTNAGADTITISVTGLSIASGKTLTASNTLTLTGTDGSTLNIGTGGTLGTAAFANTSAGGNGAADNNKVARYGAGGGLAATATGTSSVGVGCTVTGADAYGVNVDVTSGINAVGLRGVANGTDTIAVLGMGAAAGAIGLRAVQSDPAAIPLQIQNTNEVNLDITFAGTDNRTLVIPDEASMTMASRAWVNGGNITAVGTVTAGTWNGSVIGSSYGGAGSINGVLRANGSGVVSAAVAGTDYLAPNGNGSALTNLNASNLASGTIPNARFPATLPSANGSALTALNATQLTTGTVPDARFPATLPAVSGANLTALNAGNISSGTLAVARGGTGAADSYGILRAGMHACPVAYPALWWTPSTISGTVTSGTQATDFFPFLQVAASTNGQARLSVNVGSAGPVWPGADNLVDYGRKAVARFRLITRLSAHADSKIAAHFAHTSVTSHTSYDRAVRGLSVIWTGGASAGTVFIQAHNGTTNTNSATASFPINDVTGYSWVLEWEPGVAARLYRNGTLQCTLTTGLPSGTQGSSACGMLFLAGNSTNGSGNATLLRFMHADFLEVP